MKQLAVLFTMFLVLLSLITVVLAPAAAEPQGEPIKIHFNLKEDVNGPLSLETTGNPEDEAIIVQPPRSYSSYPSDCERSRDWVTIGEWTSSLVEYNVSLSGSFPVFNIWWMEDDGGPSDCPDGRNYEADASFRWTLTYRWPDNSSWELETSSSGNNAVDEPASSRLAQYGFSVLF